MKVDTIKVRADNAQGYKLINATDFNPSVHKAFDDEATAARKERNLADAEATEKLAAERRAQANYGQVDGNGVGSDGGKNPSGTFSEPTPTDVRYPNKDHTEFENNHGAFVAKSAAQMREERGLPDAPGGLTPDPNFDPTAGATSTTDEPGLFNGADETKFDHDDDGEPGGSLTKAEIAADLTAMGVDFDPRDKKADLLAQRDKARADRG